VIQLSKIALFLSDALRIFGRADRYNQSIFFQKRELFKQDLKHLDDCSIRIEVHKVRESACIEVSSHIDL